MRFRGKPIRRLWFLEDQVERLGRWALAPTARLRPEPESLECQRRTGRDRGPEMEGTRFTLPKQKGAQSRIKDTASARGPCFEKMVYLIADSCG